MKTTSQSDLLRRHAEEIAALKATIARQAREIAKLRNQLIEPYDDMSKCTTCGMTATEWPGGVPRCFEHSY